MKNFLFFYFLMFGFWSNAQLKWHSIQEAILLQKSNPKKIIINFISDECKSCKSLEEKTFRHPALTEYLNNHYYLVKFNTDTTENISIFGRNFKGKSTIQNKHELAHFMNIHTVPSIVFLDEKADFITLIQGKLSPQEFEPYILFMNSKNYKKVIDKKTWEAYTSGFRPKLTK